jgi:hypothetical protein
LGRFFRNKQETRRRKITKNRVLEASFQPAT